MYAVGVCAVILQRPAVKTWNAPCVNQIALVANLCCISVLLPLLDYFHPSFLLPCVAGDGFVPLFGGVSGAGAARAGTPQKVRQAHEGMHTKRTHTDRTALCRYVCIPSIVLVSGRRLVLFVAPDADVSQHSEVICKLRLLKLNTVVVGGLYSAAPIG